MRNLHKTRDKGYALRVQTPDVLAGEISPWTGRPFRKTITIGLGTRVHAEAVRLRGVRLGQLRQLEAEVAQAAGQKNVRGMIDLSPESAREWREIRSNAGDRFDLILTDKLEDAARAGFEREAKRFADVVLRAKLPLDEALEQYLEDRRPGNPLGLDRLKPATMADVRSLLKHLKAFLGPDGVPCGIW